MVVQTAKKHVSTLALCGFVRVAFPNLLVMTWQSDWHITVPRRSKKTMSFPVDMAINLRYPPFLDRHI